MSYVDDARIKVEFDKLNSKENNASDPVHNTPLFFNIADKIIDKINDDKFLIKITFREFLAYATPIVFNRVLDEDKINELYASIVEGYDIPFTIDYSTALYPTLQTYQNYTKSLRDYVQSFKRVWQALNNDTFPIFQP